MRRDKFLQGVQKQDIVVPFEKNLTFISKQAVTKFCFCRVFLFHTIPLLEKIDLFEKWNSMKQKDR